MIKSMFVYLAIVLVFTKPTVTSLFAVSENNGIPRLIGLDDLISVVNNSQSKYVYFDITSSGSAFSAKNTLKDIAKTASPNFIKHMSAINTKQLQKLETSLQKFNSSNTFTVENITQIGSQTGKVIIDQNLLTSDILKIIDSGSLAILNFHQQSPRLLQQTTQTNTSPMLSVMTPSALSGLLVAGFLLVVLLIAINCLMDLKTNDRFPRNILNVGKQS